jgi:diguanylate cyclase (GGDEF)-like protein
MEEFSRIERPMGIMIVDIDHFKSINDTYGHDVGDEVIKGLANTIREYTRYHDIAARIGGEEFAVVAPNVDIDSLDKLANRLRLAVSDLVFNVGNVRLRITVSIGIAIWDGKEGSASSTSAPTPISTTPNAPAGTASAPELFSALISRNLLAETADQVFRRLRGSGGLGPDRFRLFPDR